jgi:hypothetical protein
MHYIKKQDYMCALQKFESISENANKSQLRLRYASVFLKYLPEPTIDAISKFKDIDVENWCPAS